MHGLNFLFVHVQFILSQRYIVTLLSFELTITLIFLIIRDTIVILRLKNFLLFQYNIKMCIKF